MAETKGMLCECDRCGAQVFRKTIGDGEADGGYTRWNKFEPYPEGWELVYIPNAVGKRSNCIMCCPACTALWNNILTREFVAGTRLYPAKIEEEFGDESV